MAYICNLLIIESILFLIKEEIFFSGIVGPDVFDGLVDLAVVFKFLKVLDYFFGGAGTVGVIDEFVFGRGPRSIVQATGKFKCSIHSISFFNFSSIGPQI